MPRVNSPIRKAHDAYRARRNREYLAGRAWHCPKSPHGAHYWEHVRSYTDGRNDYRCRHCAAARTLDTLAALRAIAPTG